jgi:hypothetical protein
VSVFKHPKSPFYQIEFHIDGHPFRGSSKTANKKEAEAIERQWREKVRADLATKKRTGNGVLTLSLAGGRYMQEVMQGKASEGDSYRALQRLIKVIGGDTRMDDITDSHVATYIAIRRKETRWGRKEFKDGSPVGTVSGATINREVAVLKRLFFRSRRTWKIPLPNEPDWRGHIQPEEPERVCEFDDTQTDLSMPQSATTICRGLSSPMLAACGSAKPSSGGLPSTGPRGKSGQRAKATSGW